MHSVESAIWSKDTPPHTRVEWAIYATGAFSERAHWQISSYLSSVKGKPDRHQERINRLLDVGCAYAWPGLKFVCWQRNT